MDFLGSITAAPGIDLGRWLQLIESHPKLAAFPSREGINPFTKGPYTYRAHPGDAHVVVNGEKVGAMTWAQDGTNRIDVEGTTGLVEPVAIEVAAELAGAYRRGG
jgi:hypothetical protein